MKKENWLVTGGCGFIGNNLIRQLVDAKTADRQIRVLDNYSVGRLQDLRRVVPAAQESDDWHHEHATVIVGDVRNKEDVARAMSGATHVVHLAACTGVVPAIEDPFFDQAQNVLGTLNMLEAARLEGIKAFVFASSSAPLGMVEPPVHERHAPNPASPYGASKLAGEGYCQAYANCFEIPTVSLRFGNVYGPFSDKKSSVVAKFIQKALNNEKLEIYGDGTATRDFVYVEDLCDAIQLAAKQAQNQAGQIFQIATSRELSINDLCEELNRAFVSRGIKGVVIENVGERKGDVPRNFADVTKAREKLGWTANTTLQDGILNTIDWHLLNRD